jgi:hypothetical protein
MSRCHFCYREFENPQAAKAHLRWCQAYLKLKPFLKKQNSFQRSSFPSFNQAGSGSGQPPSYVVGQNASTNTELNQAAQLKQKRDALLTALCTRLVDWYRAPEGVITSDMAVAAKVAIFDELGTLPIEELSQTELNLRAESIRNRIFAPYMRAQQEQIERQQEHLERQKDSQHQEALRRQEASETESRRAKRKATLIELGVARALRLAHVHGIRGRALVVLDWQVRSRLEILLVGDETESQVEDTIEASIEPPILKWAARLEEMQQAKQGRMLDECLSLALLVAQAAWPWMKDSVANTPQANDGSTAPTNVKPDQAPDVSSSSSTPGSSMREAEKPISHPKRTATG